MAYSLRPLLYLFLLLGLALLLSVAVGAVFIPPGGRTGALVETVVTWVDEPAGSRSRRAEPETFSTIGVDSDQMAAAVIATEKMLNALAPPPPARRKRRARA